MFEEAAASVGGGYGWLSGADVRNALAQLYASSWLLKSKTRDGIRVRKVYLAPATPCDRLLAHDSVESAIKEKLKAQFKGFDPVRLLQEMRTAQQTLSEFAGPRRARSNSAGRRIRRCCLPREPVVGMEER
jgi:hypothetical protein